MARWPALVGRGISSPLWAAFASLVNQQCAALGVSPIGFANPVLYNLGAGANYANEFHDIVVGNNTNSSSPNAYFAVTGFDLCTGWGTPKPSLINDLANAQVVPLTGWTQTPFPDTDWSAVASSSDGTKLMAVDMGGGDSIYVSSTSGSLWNAHGPTGDWRGIACSADGTKAAAALWGGPIYISSDSGLTWTPAATPSYEWGSMTCSADGTKMAAGDTHHGITEVSTDSGASWTNAHFPGSYVVAWSANGNVLLALSGSQICVSHDAGATYALTASSGTNLRALACSADGSTIITCGNQTLYVSTNMGQSWKTSALPSQAWGSVACSADGYRLVAGSGGSSPRGNIYLSNDRGMTWTLNDPPAGSLWNSVACSADGTKLIASSQPAYGGGQLYTGYFPRSPIILNPPTNQTIQCGLNASFAVTEPAARRAWPINGILDQTRWPTAQALWVRLPQTCNSPV